MRARWNVLLGSSAWLHLAAGFEITSGGTRHQQRSTTSSKRGEKGGGRKKSLATLVKPFWRLVLRSALLCVCERPSVRRCTRDHKFLHSFALQHPHSQNNKEKSKPPHHAHCFPCCYPPLLLLGWWVGMFKREPTGPSDIPREAFHPLVSNRRKTNLSLSLVINFRSLYA